MMPAFVQLFLLLLHSVGLTSTLCLGHQLIYLSPSLLPSGPLLTSEIVMDHARMISVSLAFPQPRQSKPHISASFAPSRAPSLFPTHPVSAAAPSKSSVHHHHQHGHHHHNHHHHRHVEPQAMAPSPSEQGCNQICMEPLTAVPYGSPCGCVFPMKVKLLLDIALYTIFPVMNELEIEIAAGTYLQQSQVKIMGASADSQNQGQTVVDINLVPLGEKFDNETALLTYKRFLHKRVRLNGTLFGNYKVISISYPGLPSPPPHESNMGSGPSGSTGDLPVTANFVNKSQRINLRIVFIVALSTFALFLILIGAMWVFMNLRKARRPSSAFSPMISSSIGKRSGTASILSSNIPSSASLSLTSAMATCLLSVKTFPLAELEKATDKFSSKRILGEGGFGRVYRGTIEDGCEIAVKLLTIDNQNGEHGFIQEVEMLSRLHHRNLVKLVGVCTEGHIRCLVYEVVPNGSVESHLHGADKKKGCLDWDARLKIALGAARGLAYLHEDSNPRVIHRDFKASNILLEDDFTPKVSDFGLAKEANGGSQHISTRVMGTFGYVAPEYAMTGHLLVKSDVYSYGVVLLELLTGRKPVDMFQHQGHENLVTWARPLLTSREGLEQLVDSSLSGAYNFDDMAKVAAVANMCVHPEVTKRPFMGEVVQALKLIYNDADETCADCCSQKESSISDSKFNCDLSLCDSSWWSGDGVTPRFTYLQASSFVTMDYSSGPLEEMENRPFSASGLIGDGMSLPITHGNRSGPLRTVRSKFTFYRLRGSMSEHVELLTRRISNNPGWS